MPIILNDRWPVTKNEKLINALSNVQEAAAHVQPAVTAQNVTTQIGGRALPAPAPTTGQSLRVTAGGVFEWFTPAAGADLSAYVLKVGDVMTGALQVNDTGTVITPAGMLHLASDAALAPKADVYNDTTTTKAELFFRRARGTAALPTGVLAGNDLGRVAFSGHDTSAFTGARAGIFAEATEDWTTTANGTRLVFQVSATGAETILQPMNLTSAGLSLGAALGAVSALDVNSPTGGLLTISRVDSIVNAGDVIGTLQFWNDDAQLTTQKIYGNIEVQAAQTISTDAAAGKLIVRVTGGASGGAPVEQMNLVDGTLTFKEALNLAVGTGTGSKLGTAAAQKLSLWGVAPVVQPVLAAYTSDAESAAYTGAADSEAKLADLNSLRVAYETLRVLVEDMRTKLITTGIVA